MRESNTEISQESSDNKLLEKVLEAFTLEDFKSIADLYVSLSKVDPGSDTFKYTIPKIRLFFESLLSRIVNYGKVPVEDIRDILSQKVFSGNHSLEVFLNEVNEAREKELLDDLIHKTRGALDSASVIGISAFFVKSGLDAQSKAALKEKCLCFLGGMVEEFGISLEMPEEEQDMRNYNYLEKQTIKEVIENCKKKYCGAEES